MRFHCIWRETLKCQRMKDATHICEWHSSIRMRYTEERRTGENWGRCEGLLKRFHLVGRKCIVLFYRLRLSFFSFYKFTYDTLSFCHEFLEHKISYWKWSCEYRQQALYAQHQRVLNLRKIFEYQTRKKRHRIKEKEAIYTCTYEIKRKYIQLRFLKNHAFTIRVFRHFLEIKYIFKTM
jgi:hypothetical protein